ILVQAEAVSQGLANPAHGAPHYVPGRVLCVSLGLAALDGHGDLSDFCHPASPLSLLSKLKQCAYVLCQDANPALLVNAVRVLRTEVTVRVAGVVRVDWAPIGPRTVVVLGVVGATPAGDQRVLPEQLLDLIDQSHLSIPSLVVTRSAGAP